jgi:hypothetical protein
VIKTLIVQVVRRARHQCALPQAILIHVQVTQIAHLAIHATQHRRHAKLTLVNQDAHRTQTVLLTKLATHHRAPMLVHVVSTLIVQVLTLALHQCALLLAILILLQDAQKTQIVL